IGIVALLKQRIRETDSIYRFGGEEFLILAEQATSAVAASLAETLRVLVSETPIIDERQVTISVGVAQLHQSESTDDWLKRADVALYQAKENGRNAVVAAPILSEASDQTIERQASGT
ncbi:MAG: GGDEF domain-containing protein, partial [Woeseiaceae bacterium]